MVENTNTKYAIGIDFGTTYSCIGVFRNGGVEIIPNALGERTTPSVVMFEDDKSTSVGEQTLNHLCKNPKNKVYEVKRLIGSKYNTIEKFVKNWTFEVENVNGDPKIKIEFPDKKINKYTPEQIASEIFKRLKYNADTYLNTKITEAVVTIPAYFHKEQRQAVIAAAENAGLKVLKLINEPSSAALAYGFTNKYRKKILTPFGKDTRKKFDRGIVTAAGNDLLGVGDLMGNNNDNEDEEEAPPRRISDDNLIIEEENKVEEISQKNQINVNNTSISNTNYEVEGEDRKILVFDFGGGTFDVSLIEVIDGVIFDVIITSGNPQLGGGDFDNILTEYCIEEFSKIVKIDSKILKEKIRPKTLQRLRMECENVKKMLSLRNTFTGTVFLNDFYEENDLSIEITRAKFEEKSKHIFDLLMKPIKSVLDHKRLHPSEIKEIILVGGSSKIPKIKKMLKEKFGNNVIINDTINPDEAVAFGATLQAEKIVHNNNELLKEFDLQDSIPMSLGIGTVNPQKGGEELMSIIIPKGKHYPTKKITDYFFNLYDYQIDFHIGIYQGEDKYTKNNAKLKEIVLGKIPKKKSGELCLAVEFEVDKNCILKVNAYEMEKGVKNYIEEIIGNVSYDVKDLKKGFEDIVPNNNVNQDEIEIKMLLNSIIKRWGENKEPNERYNLIDQYSKALIKYLEFYEKVKKDVETERYLLLVEKLFDSYAILLNNNEYKSKINEEEIKNSIKLYFKFVIEKNPFRTKQLLTLFLKDRKESDLFLMDLAIYCLELLEEKGKNYLNGGANNDNNRRNNEDINNINKYNAKNIYEECSTIIKIFIDEEKINPDLGLKLGRIKPVVKNNCLKIAVELIPEIQETKKTGKLFSNPGNLGNDELYIILSKLRKSIFLINNIEELNNDKEALELKSISLANMVQIDYTFLKNNTSKSMNDQKEKCNQTLLNADSSFPEIKNKEWYKDISKIKQNLEKEIERISINVVASHRDNKEEILGKLESLSTKSHLDYINYILKEKPYKGYIEGSCNVEESLRRRKRGFIAGLVRDYTNSINNDNNPEDVVNNEIYEKIVGHLNEIKDACD